MGCSSQKNAQVDDTDTNKNKKNEGGEKNKKKENPDIKKKENKELALENDENDNDADLEEEELELGDENNIEKLKKKHMINEYIFYPTKEIPKKRFVKKDIDKVLPSDFANKEKSNKDKQYYCFQKKLNKPKVKKNKFIPDDESEKNNLLQDEIYNFNKNLSKMKSVRPLKREEILKPYNYQIEYDINDDGLLEKRSNKDNSKYDYLDMFPNGEAYKFINRDDDNEKEEKEKKNLVEEAKLKKQKEIEEKKIELINKNDENNIANIINKELKENGLLQDNKKVVENANDF